MTLHYFISIFEYFSSIKARLPVARIYSFYLVSSRYEIYMLYSSVDRKKSCYISIIIIKAFLHYPIFIDVK